MKYDVKEEVKGLIFDLDGTLADSMPWHFRAWKRACEEYGINMESSFLKARMGRPGWRIAGELVELNNRAGEVDPSSIVSLKVAEFKKIQHNIKPVAPVADIVKRYHGRLPMAVGTGGHREAVERTLEIIGMRDYFDIVVTANDVEKHKPHPETFLRCADMMGVEPGFTEVFEDGDPGLEAAARAGMIVTNVRGWYDSDW